MPRLDPYLNFAGNTEEAFEFYRSVFGGEFTAVMRFGEMPGCDEMQLKEEEKGKIMHISLPVGNAILMATDSLESMGQKLEVGNNTHLSFSPDSREEADRVFAALADGGKVNMPLQDMFWGDYWGSLTDKFGVNWMVNVGQPPTN
ncbi:VOC family protein [Leptolyngbya sp. 7M]|uniref:VOC family protein n=1 Tax=Leptolyngbya sp. 7M TaxID=2812896 RepID=UPI001B8B53F3|nr:VOC family protein [Leptolyngbya sp. 7M]QYO66802.1 VOC family protein [Leptolyngbya sp. 7M]